MQNAKWKTKDRVLIFHFAFSSTNILHKRNEKLKMQNAKWKTKSTLYAVPFCIFNFEFFILQFVC